MSAPTSLLYTDTVLNAKGHEYTLEIQHDWMAGHGVFTDKDGKANRYHWTIYLETLERPRMAYKYNVDDLNMAIVQGTERLRTYR